LRDEVRLQALLAKSICPALLQEFIDKAHIAGNPIECGLCGGKDRAAICHDDESMPPLAQELNSVALTIGDT